jgi:hypothetical protein
VRRKIASVLHMLSHTHGAPARCVPSTSRIACRWLYVGAAGEACQAHGARRVALQSTPSRAPAATAKDVSRAAGTALQACLPAGRRWCAPSGASAC